MKTGIWIAALALCAPLIGCGDDDDTAAFYTRTDLVSSIEGRASTFDPNLVDPWGVASGPDTFLWVANRATATATVYDEQGQRVFLQTGEEFPPQFVVDIPSPVGPGAVAGPTDVVYNASGEFEVDFGGSREDSEFLFATLEGSIAGWGEDLFLDAGLLLDTGGAAAFTGLALPLQSDLRLYAVDFLRGQVVVFDDDLEVERDLDPTAFIDPELDPDLVPFGISSIDGDLYVSYVRRSGDPLTPAAGSGAVVVYDEDGELQWRLDPAFLDAPYAVVEAPGDFGRFSDAVLVGNTGDGTIQAFDADEGYHLGSLTDGSGTPIVIPGLRDLHFGLRDTDGTDQLFFTATLDETGAGLFGRIQAAPTQNL
jgi:uncharacterized protein (TIGR03118 family)